VGIEASLSLPFGVESALRPVRLEDETFKISKPAAVRVGGESTPIAKTGKESG
jgi:hypothetical protein